MTIELVFASISQRLDRLEAALGITEMVAAEVELDAELARMDVEEPPC